MSFSVTCSNCDRRFVDIDESLIGQQARCRCGEIVELDPEWDFNKNKRRASTRKRPAPIPAKAEESSKRKLSNAGAKRTKSRTPNPESGPQRRNQRPRPQPAAAESSSPPVSDTADREGKTKTKAETPAETQTQASPKIKSSDEALFDNYADLDQILAAGVDHTPLEPTRVDSPFEQPAAIKESINRRGSVGAAVSGLTGLLAAFILLITRASAFGGTPLGWNGQVFYGTYTASYGSGEMTSTCTNLFLGFGWWFLLLAILTGIASGLLLIRVATQITSGRKALAWSRGLMATLSVICLFSLMGLLFVQTIHHGNLIRDLNSFSDSAPIEGLLEPAGEVDTFHDVRVKYKSENTDFMIGVLTFAMLPLISFGGVAVSLLFDED